MQKGGHIADDTFKRIFLNENGCILITISLKFVPKGPINNIPALVRIMAGHQSGDKPLSEPVMPKFIDAYICITQPQWIILVPVCKSSHCNWFEGGVPLDVIYGYPIIKSVSLTWQGWDDSSSSIGHHITMTS